jgi:DNA modification methylase
MISHAVQDIRQLSALPISIQAAVSSNELPFAVAVELASLNDSTVNEKILQLVERKKKYEKNLLKHAIFAVQKSKQMREKFVKLKKLSETGVVLSSVWAFGNRDNYAGDPHFYGNAPTQAVEQCILRLTNPKDIVVDPMAGSGTTLDVCATLKRKGIGFDLSPTRPDIKANDSTSIIPLASNSADLVFFHPPYWNMVKYSKNKADISNLPLPEFFEKIQNTLTESYRILKKDKYLCILIGDVVEQGKFIPLTRKTSNIAESIGFEDAGWAVKITKGSVSEQRRGKAIYAELAQTKNLKQNHDTVMFWKK